MKIINVEDYRFRGILYYGDLLRDIIIFNRIEMSNDTRFNGDWELLEYFDFEYKRQE